MELDDLYRIERAVFIGKESESTFELLSNVKLPGFKLGIYYADSAKMLLSTCCDVESSLLLMDMRPESVNILLNSREIQFISNMPVIAFAPYKCDAFARLAAELKLYRLFVRTSDIKKDAEELSDILTVKVIYGNYEEYPNMRAHIVSRNSWHDPTMEIVDYDKAISELIEKLGIRKSLAGHKYLVAAISMHCATTSPPELKYLYRLVADHYGTTSLAVEKAIRYAIESAWNKGDYYEQNRLFGLSIDESRGKPTNAEFIARISLEYVYK